MASAAYHSMLLPALKAALKARLLGDFDLVEAEKIIPSRPHPSRADDEAKAAAAAPTVAAAASSSSTSVSEPAVETRADAATAEVLPLFSTASLDVEVGLVQQPVAAARSTLTRTTVGPLCEPRGIFHLPLLAAQGAEQSNRQCDKQGRRWRNFGWRRGKLGRSCRYFAWRRGQPGRCWRYFVRRHGKASGAAGRGRRWRDLAPWRGRSPDYGARPAKSEIRGGGSADAVPTAARGQPGARFAVAAQVVSCDSAGVAAGNSSSVLPMRVGPC
jgi:hypothetical protein